MNKKRYVIVIVLLIAAVFVGLFGFTRVKEIVEHKRAIEHIHDKEADVIDWIYSFGTNTNIKAIEAYELNGTLFYHVDFSDEEVIGIDSEPEFCEFDGALIYYGESSRQLINFNWSESSKEYERKFFDWYDEAVREGVYYKYNDDELNSLINEYKG